MHVPHNDPRFGLQRMENVRSPLPILAEFFRGIGLRLFPDALRKLRTFVQPRGTEIQKKWPRHQDISMASHSPLSHVNWGR